MLCLNCQQGVGTGQPRDIGIDAGVGAYQIYLNGCGEGTNQSLPAAVQQGVCNTGLHLQKYQYDLFWGDGQWFEEFTRGRADLQIAAGSTNPGKCPAASSSPTSLSTSPPPTGTSAPQITTSMGEGLSGQTETKGDDDSHKTAALLGGTLAAAFVVIMLIALIIYLLRRRRNQAHDYPNTPQTQPWTGYSSTPHDDTDSSGPLPSSNFRIGGNSDIRNGGDWQGHSRPASTVLPDYQYVTTGTGENAVPPLPSAPATAQVDLLRGLPMSSNVKVARPRVSVPPAYQS